MFGIIKMLLDGPIRRDILKLAINKTEQTLILNALAKTINECIKEKAFDFKISHAIFIIKKAQRLIIEDIADLILSHEEMKIVLFSLYFTAPERIVKTHELSDLIFMIIYEMRMNLMASE